MRIGENAMAFVPIPDGARVVVGIDQYGQRAILTHNFISPPGWGYPDMVALGEAVWDAYAAWFPNVYTAAYSLTDVTVTDARVQFADQYVTTHAPVVGAASGSVLPNNVAIAVARRSTLTGRSTRGRQYFPVGRFENTSVGNQITTAFRDSILTMLDAMETATGAVDWTEVIASFVQNGVALPTAAVYVVVSRLVVDLVIDSMRRRLPGRGE